MATIMMHYLIDHKSNIVRQFFTLLLRSRQKHQTLYEASLGPRSPHEFSLLMVSSYFVVWNPFNAYVCGSKTCVHPFMLTNTHKLMLSRKLITTCMVGVLKILYRPRSSYELCSCDTETLSLFLVLAPTNIHHFCSMFGT